MAIRLEAVLIAVTSFTLLARAQDPPFTVPVSVVMKPGLVYSEPNGEWLHLDLFVPRQGDGPFPAIVFVHGRDWGRGRGDRSAFWRQAAYLAQDGFVAATIQYRYEDGATWPAGLNDVQASIRWLRTNAATYHVDAARIAVGGGSTGGYLAALAGTNLWNGSDWSGSAPDVRVNAVVAYNPLTDLPALAGSSEFTSFLGASYEQNPARWRDASPISHVGPQAAPVLLLHGTGDQDVPYKQSTDMLRVLKEANVRAELFTADGGVHGFGQSPPWFEPALKRVEAFLKSVLK